MNKLSTAQLKQIAKEKLKGNWGIVLGAILIYSIAISLASSAAGILELVVIGPLTVGLCCLLLNVFRNGKADIGDLFKGFDNFFNNFITGLLVTVFTFLWSLLFVIPGIVKSYAYSMTYFIQYDHPEMTETDAITASRKMMHGNKMDLFLLDLSFLGWYLLSALTFGLLLLYVGPYHRAARVAFYENLKAEQAKEQGQAEAVVSEEPSLFDEPQAIEAPQSEEVAEEDIVAPEEPENPEGKDVE